MKLADEQPGATAFTGGLYPWSAWADGQERIAVAGEDFQCTAPAFAQAARSWAERHGFTANVVRRGQRVWFSFVPDAAARMSPQEIMAKFIDQELIPDSKGWISQADVLAGYAAWIASRPNEPKATKRQILAGVRASYPLRRHDGVTGYAGTR